ncbi:hypothetical protein [Streptomyces sp. NPDC008150]|uniref:hypothetical protein n=1 Tax=Streptomyces sp. NPDC008150 TaxID=3364816 RepID=UPI0036E6E96B
MSHFPHATEFPEPAPVPPGRWPELQTALAAVNRDLRATLPEQEPLILVAVPAWESAATGDRVPEHVYVAMADGSWQGNSLNEYDPEDGGRDWPAEPATVLGMVADAAQETVMELLWRAWPTCWVHKSGVHVRTPGTGPDGESGEEPPPGRAGEAAGQPVWWCRGGRAEECHDLAAVGELAEALPGRQRRAFRRGERETRR